MHTCGLSTHRRASLYQSEGDGAGPSVRSRSFCSNLKLVVCEDSQFVF
nr:MAG TPA: hypothetical protein [Caudoviricetes sp.]